MKAKMKKGPDKTAMRATEPEKALELKKGGTAKKKKAKHVGKVHGKHAHKRLDKMKRGGKCKMAGGGMTPSSPLSGAGKISERGGFSSSASVDKEND